MADFRLAFQKLAEKVEFARDQRLVRSGRHVAGERLAAKRDVVFQQVDRHVQVGVGANRVGDAMQVGAGRRNTGNAERRAIAEEDLGERFPDDGLDSEPHERLRGVLAGGAAAEIPADDKNFRGPVARIVKRVVRILFSVVLEGVLAEPFEGDALQVAGRNDPVRVDVVQEQGKSRAGHAFDFLHG